MVWRQRNNIIHNQITISPSAVFKDIDRHALCAKMIGNRLVMSCFIVGRLEKFGRGLTSLCPLMLRMMPTQSVTRLSLNPRCAVRWTKPPLDTLKCNIHISWLNDVHICGGAWIVRNHHGDAAFHAREMFLPASNRIAAELRGVLWVLHSLRDLHLDNIEIWSDCLWKPLVIP
ncbi:unnamed protein product [Arabidopsis thaliana]|uniref:RNase H type-1 domain-containing protein n=1 Tax=Arabidopsis thaliana TaxID=3702 RepID=A0A5S9XRE9_ARATH|nr:unnamed protein product [Arabidopsis thaliana]